MNWLQVYDSLIENAKKRTNLSSSGFEHHHIIPKCLNGSDDPSNIVSLTLREHFIAHKLLVLIYPENKQLKQALWIITITTIEAYKKYLNGTIESNDYRVFNRINYFVEHSEKSIISSRDYEWCKLQCSIAKKGKKYTKEQRKNVSEGTKKGMQDPEKAKLRRRGVLNSVWYTNKETGEMKKWFPGMEPFKYPWVKGMNKLTEETKEKLRITQSLQERKSICNKEYGVNVVIDKRVIKLPEGWEYGFFNPNQKKNRGKETHKLKTIFNTVFRDIHHLLVINGYFISDYYYVQGFTDKEKGTSYSLGLYHFLLPEIRQYYNSNIEKFKEVCYNKLINQLDDLKFLNKEIYGVEDVRNWK